MCTMLKNLVCGPNKKYSIQFKYFGKYLFDCLNERRPSETIAINSVTNESLRCGDLLSKSINLATHMQKLSLKKGDVVSLVSENNFNCYIVACATLFCGATLQPLNYAYTSNELKHAFTLSKPKLVFSSKTSINKISSIQKDVNSIQKIVSTDHETVFNHVNLNELTNTIGTTNFFEPVVGDASDTALLCLSSGTTGLPKCVELSHQNLIPITNFADDKEYVRFTSEDVITLFLPFFHIYGLLIYFLAIIKSFTVILMQDFKPDTFLQIVEKYRGTKLFLVPPTLLFLNNLTDSQRRLASVQDILVGGAPLSNELYQSAAEKFSHCSVRQMYGATETCGLCVMETVGNTRPKANIGKPLWNTTVKIADVNTNKVLGPFENGEICIKTLSIMKGYLNNPFETKNCIDNDGFYHTGDIGYYDQHKHLFIVIDSKN
ncbi:hypothetical protein FQR65_LT07607 [Abscondita terminalis]|nr:hypothetical protein FQR65_LT07607 [Abscondita terminalis]